MTIIQISHTSRYDDEDNGLREAVAELRAFAEEVERGPVTYKRVEEAQVAARRVLGILCDAIDAPLEGLEE